MFGVVSKSSEAARRTRGLSGNFRTAPGSPDRLRNPWNGSERLRAVARRFRTAACVSERLRALRSGCEVFGTAATISKPLRALWTGFGDVVPPGAILANTIPRWAKSAQTQGDDCMCGIAGIYRFRSARPVEPGEVRTMGACLAHRGPDDEGYFNDGPLGLAHKRLSIVDTSSRGRNPLWSEDGKSCIVFNGEVYNFVELRAELETQGHSFRTTTDTEVILRLWDVLGEACLERLNGMTSVPPRTRRSSSA